MRNIPIALKGFSSTFSLEVKETKSLFWSWISLWPFGRQQGAFKKLKKKKTGFGCLRWAVQGTVWWNWCQQPINGGRFTALRLKRPAPGTEQWHQTNTTMICMLCLRAAANWGETGQTKSNSTEPGVWIMIIGGHRCGGEFGSQFKMWYYEPRAPQTIAAMYDYAWLSCEFDGPVGRMSPNLASLSFSLLSVLFLREREKAVDSHNTPPPRPPPPLPSIQGLSKSLAMKPPRLMWPRRFGVDMSKTDRKLALSFSLSFLKKNFAQKTKKSLRC